jgi:hypothetical protein
MASQSPEFPSVPRPAFGYCNVCGAETDGFFAAQCANCRSEIDAAWDATLCESCGRREDAHRDEWGRWQPCVQSIMDTVAYHAPEKADA